MNKLFSLIQMKKKIKLNNKQLTIVTRKIKLTPDIKNMSHPPYEDDNSSKLRQLYNILMSRTGKSE